MEAMKMAVVEDNQTPPPTGTHEKESFISAVPTPTSLAFIIKQLFGPIYAPIIANNCRIEDFVAIEGAVHYRI